MTSLTTTTREQEKKKLPPRDDISSSIEAAKILVETIHLMNRRINALEVEVESLKALQGRSQEKK